MTFLQIILIGSLILVSLLLVDMLFEVQHYNNLLEKLGCKAVCYVPVAFEINWSNISNPNQTSLNIT